jgi:hypothetical protein
MIVATSIAIYFALLGLIAYEDLFQGKGGFTLQA